MPTEPLTALADYEALARERLDPTLVRHVDEGDDGSNARAFATLRILPRPLADVRGGTTRCTIFGERLDHPILLAPVAYQRLFHPDGEAASAMAAAAQGSVCVVSSLASQPLDAIARAGRRDAGQAPWFQLYWQGDRDRTARLLDRALDAGYTTIVFTVDAPVKRASLALPRDVGAVNVEPAPAPSPPPGGSVVFDAWMRTSPTWDDVAWLRERSRLPLVLKGVMHPDDAEHALALGCDGIVVSNHGGRVLHGAAATADVLPDIVARIDGRIPVLVDGGIRSGRDVFVALALGASAVLVGRPYLWALAVDGAMGVARAIRILRDELEMTMALTGCATLEAIRADRLFSSPPRA